jgi:hypothetical protein
MTVQIKCRVFGIGSPRKTDQNTAFFEFFGGFLGRKTVEMAIFSVGIGVFRPENENNGVFFRENQLL